MPSKGKKANDSDLAATSGRPRLSWAEQLSQMTKEEREKERMKRQIAFNNSPEAKELDRQVLESLKEEWYKDQELLK